LRYAGKHIGAPVEAADVSK